MAQRLLSWHYENEARTKEACKEILVRLKRLHLDPVLERLKGREGAKVSFQNITNAYDKIKDDYGKFAKGAEDVIAAVFFEYHRVRKPSLMLLSYVPFYELIAPAGISIIHHFPEGEIPRRHSSNSRIY